MRGFQIPALVFCLLVLFPSIGTASSPSRLWSQDETVLWAGTVVAAGGLSLLDEDIRSFFQKNRGEPGDSVADAFDTFGHALSTLAIGGGIYTYARVRDDVRTAETGKMAVHAVLGSQAAVLVLKVAVGRERPASGGDAHAFDPFNFSNETNAFPSGHTAASFALASVLAKRSTSSWEPYAYYGLAAAVGVSRLVRDEHWATDVLAGALIGETAARLTMRWNERRSDGGDGADTVQIGFVPLQGGGLLALSGRW